MYITIISVPKLYDFPQVLIVYLLYYILLDCSKFWGHETLPENLLINFWE